MSTYGLGVLPSLFASSASPHHHHHSHTSGPLRAPTPRALSPNPSLLDDGDDERDSRRDHRRASNSSSSSSSSDDDCGPTRKARTSPDFSSLTPHPSAPTSPLRAPGLSSPASSSLSSSLSPHLAAAAAAGGRAPVRASPLASPGTGTVDAAADADECEDGGELSTLPTRVPRPKSKADRERERALGLVPHPGQKREGLGVKLARKRANSLKWAKYANVGAFEVELGLSNDDLKRDGSA